LPKPILLAVAKGNRRSYCPPGQIDQSGVKLTA
jgi:hypothetical protein